jgi:hypothetical protein
VSTEGFSAPVKQGSNSNVYEMTSTLVHHGWSDHCHGSVRKLVTLIAILDNCLNTSCEAGRDMLFTPWPTLTLN